MSSAGAPKAREGPRVGEGVFYYAFLVFKVLKSFMESAKEDTSIRITTKRKYMELYKHGNTPHQKRLFDRLHQKPQRLILCPQIGVLFSSSTNYRNLEQALT